MTTNFVKRRSLSILIVMTMLIALPCNYMNVYAAGGLFSSNSKTDSINIEELTIDENILLPEVTSPFVKKKICEFTQKETNRIKHNNSEYKVSLCRNGEVIKVTIPMDMLFEPNETTPSISGKKELKSLARYLRDENFKILIATHSDNTGSITYNQNLTTTRAEAIRNTFIEYDGSKNSIVCYGLSNTEPLTNNKSMANRRLNRRCDIYIIPNTPIIKLASRKKITL